MTTRFVPRFAPATAGLADRLAPLLAARGPAGFEAEAVRAWAELAGEFAEVRIDRLGSAHAVVNPGGRWSVALIGHIDEIGLTVRHIDDHGRLWVGALGMWDAAMLPGQRVTVLTGHGDVPGVVGSSPPHLGRGAAAPSMDDIWVDIGATDLADAAEAVLVGDPIVLAPAPVRLRNGRIAARALDNRLGALAVLEAARAVAAHGGERVRVTAVASVREETGFGGARAAATALAPDLALVVDTTFTSDLPVPDLDRRLGRRALGSGPAIGRGAAVDDALARRLITLAERAGLPFTIEAHGDSSLTDADAVHQAGAGVRCGALGIPVRHLHSPCELADLTDLAATIELATAFCLEAPAILPNA